MSLLSDDDRYYGSIPDFQGVWANAKTLEECREELIEVLEVWKLFRVSKDLPLPVVSNLKIEAILS